MRKFFTLLIVLVVSSAAFAQAPRILSADRAQEIATPRVINQPTQQELQQQMQRKAAPTVAQPEYATNNVTSQKIGQASNAYTFLRTEDHQLSFVPTTNSLAFLHRQDITLHGGATVDNGRLRYAYSTDGGTTWSKENGPITVTYSFPCRYPNGILTKRAGGSALDFVHADATLDGSWDGHCQGYVQDATTSSFVVSQEDYALKGTGTLIPGSLVERAPGEFWYIDLGYDGNAATGEILIYKGVESNGSVTWTETVLNPPHDVSYDGTARIASPNIAFAPAPNNNIGWAAFLGDIEGDTTYSPIFMKTTDAGATWSAPVQFDMDQFQGLTDSLQFYQAIDTTGGQTDTIPIGTGKATCSFDADLSVDGNGNPHMIAVVGNASSNFAAGGPLAGYTIYSGIILIAYDFTFDQYGDWNMMHLGSVSTLRGEHGAGASASSVFTADPWVQVSRNAPGTFMFFSWTDSDSTSAAWDSNNANGNPDLIGRGYSIHTTGSDKLTPVTNWTKGDQVWDGKALLPKISTVAISNGNNDFTVPYVIMDLETGDALATSGFHYLSDITYLGTTFNIVSTYFYNCKQDPYTSTVSSTDATCGASDGSASINVAGGTAPYTIAWSTGGSTATITGLPVGVYDVTVTDINGCVDMKQVVVNNANAATLAISGQSNPSCFGVTDGGATVTTTGGTAPFTYAWSNGETTAAATMLPGGTSSCQVTDANNCVGITQVTLSSPAQINVGETHTDVTCNGAADGTVTVIASGGTGSLEYSIDGNTFQTSNMFMGLSGGSVTVTVQDGNGCTETTTLSIAEPAAISLATSSTQDNGGNCDGTASVTVSGGSTPYNYSWSNGQQGPGANFIFGLCGGNYTVYVTDANGCTSDTVVSVALISGIEDELNAGISNLNMYPNPASSQLSVTMDFNSNESVQIAIYDLKGQIVASKSALNVTTYKEQFDLSNVAAGLYMVRINTTKGSAARKLIVE